MGLDLSLVLLRYYPPWLGYTYYISLRKTKPGAADVYFFSFFFSLWNFNGISNQPATGRVVH